MLDANENYYDFKNLEMISACSRSDSQMHKSAIDDIPPPETNLTILPNTPDSIQNTVNHITSTL